MIVRRVVSMKRVFRMAVILIMLLFSVSCSQHSPEINTLTDSNNILSNLNSDNIYNDILQLTSCERHNGSKGINKIRDLLLINMEELSYLSEIQRFTYNSKKIQLKPSAIFFNELPKDFFNISDENDNKTAYNVICIKKSKNHNAKDIILTAHYDCRKNSKGAIDNASGVATLLETARLLKNVDLKNNIYFVYFSCEEIGVIGSRYYVGNLSEENLKNIIANINVDCVGGKNDGEICIYTPTGAECPESKFGKENFATKLFPNMKPLRRSRSDNISFGAKNVPNVTIGQVDTTNSGISNTEKDTMESIDISLIGESVKLLINAIINAENQV